MIYEPTTAEIEALAREMRKSFPPNDIIDSRTNAAWILSRFVRREKHERLLAHIESSHNEVVCSSADRHAKDGNDPLPRLTCMTWDAHRLRTELHGQRCGGDGTLRGVRPGSMIGESEWIRCPSCPACTPEVTPKRVSPFCPECGAESPNGHFEKCSHSRPPQATPKGDGCGCKRGLCCGFGCGCACHEDGSHASDGVSEAGAAASEPRDVLPRNPAAPVHTSATPESMSLLEHHCSDADFATIGKLRDESYAAGYRAARDDAANGLGVQLVELGPTTLRALVEAILELQYTQHPRQCRPATADDLLANLKETK